MVEPPPALGFAIGVREAVEKGLAAPQRTWHVATNTFIWEPPITDEFHLDRVELRGSSASPFIAVFFRWDGEDELFAISYPLVHPGNREDEPSDAYISAYLEEDLMAEGFGVEHAIREPDNEATWLSWRHKR
jgi:hypothetical protein